MLDKVRIVADESVPDGTILFVLPAKVGMFTLPNGTVAQIVLKEAILEGVIQNVYAESEHAAKEVKDD
jgi:hypothetical protein